MFILLQKLWVVPVNFFFCSVLHIPTVFSVIVAMQNPKPGLENLVVAHSNVLLICYSHRKETPLLLWFIKYCSCSWDMAGLGC